MKNQIQIQAVKNNEQPFLYPQPHECLRKASAAIGCYSCSVGEDGIDGEHYWETYCKGRIGFAFMSNIQQIHQELFMVQKDSSFATKAYIERFCMHNGAGCIDPGRRIYGYRIDAGLTTYLVRIQLYGEYASDIWMYAYNHSEFDAHLQRATHGIHFPSTVIPGKDFCDIEEGDSICVCAGPGPYENCGDVYMKCRYVNEDTAVIGNQVVNLKDWVKQIKDSKRYFYPIRECLPKMCYYFQEEDGTLQELIRGQDGMQLSALNSSAFENKILAANLNNANGVTKAQEEAMWWGCVHSWVDPNADPRNYEEGFLKLLEKEREK